MFVLIWNSTNFLATNFQPPPDGPRVYKKDNKSENDDENAPLGKKQKVSMKATELKKPTAKKVRGIRGKLKYLKEMPLDILSEIFSQLDPIGLVNISRTSKDFRAILLNRSSTSVWKSARANIDLPLPDCPNDLSKPQYAELLFEKCCVQVCNTHLFSLVPCQYCQRKLGTIHISWTARKRICNKCIGEQCSEHQDGITFHATGRHRSVIDYYFSEFRKVWSEAYSKSTAKEEWRSSKFNEHRTIQEHAKLCERWLETCIERREALFEEQFQKRRNQITDRVMPLGWDDEVQKMSGYKTKFEELPEVEKWCQKGFTSSTSLDFRINDFMTKIQKAHLASERAGFLGKCLPVLQQVHSKHVESLPLRNRYWCSTANESFYESVIRDIINDALLTLDSMKEQLELAIPEVFPDATKRLGLCQRINNQLLSFIMAQNLKEEIDPKTVFELATTVFECTYLFAICQTNPTKQCYPETIPDHQHLPVYLAEGYRSHNASMSKRGMKLIPILIKLCGLDPSITTAN
ncbi:hypothetical protein BDN70DRAFT_988035, partial [Pholiota conissans]